MCSPHVLSLCKSHIHVICLHKELHTLHLNKCQYWSYEFNYKKSQLEKTSTTDLIFNWIENNMADLQFKRKSTWPSVKHGPAYGRQLGEDGLSYRMHLYMILKCFPNYVVGLNNITAWFIFTGNIYFVWSTKYSYLPCYTLCTAVKLYSEYKWFLKASAVMLPTMTCTM